MAATAEQIKKLRELTGAGVLEAKKVLDEHQGNFDQALDILKARGIARADKKAERVARSGLIETYVHGAGRVGVMLEVNCETDFVARTPDFQALAHNLALQVAAQNPKYVSRSDIPAAALDEIKETFVKETRAEGKPDAMIDRIVEGKLNKHLKQLCLLDQPYIKDDSASIQDLVKSVIAIVGENIVVRRFARYELGEEVK
jgi:elongation factor Ts